MQALVVYESMFGNTRTVAEAIGAGLAPTCQVDVVRVDEVAPGQVETADLLVVGAPTHVRGLSRPSTRRGAAQQAADPKRTLTLEPGATGSGLREWLTRLPEDTCPKNHRPENHCAVAVFDTRVEMPSVLTGRASRRIARALRDHGRRLVARPESFLVTKATRLVPGELERARAWGAELGAELGAERAPAGR